MNEAVTEFRLPSIMIVDADVLVRHVLAEYLRTCGYRVIEAASTDEAAVIMYEAGVTLEAVIADAQAPGALGGFGFARWMREVHPEVEVILAGASEKAADEAANLCEQGPHFARPYDPQLVIDHIKRLRAARTPIT